MTDTGGFLKLPSEVLAEPLPDAQTTVYVDAEGLWVEVGWTDPDDGGQRHAMRTVAMAPGLVLSPEGVRRQVTEWEELATHALKINRARRREGASE